jgi:hypothetical protein
LGVQIQLAIVENQSTGNFFASLSRTIDCQLILIFCPREHKTDSKINSILGGDHSMFPRFPLQKSLVASEKYFGYFDIQTILVNHQKA